jgi:hypothetical protein
LSERDSMCRLIAVPPHHKGTVEMRTAMMPQVG